MFSASADYYDLLYAQVKDYRAESQRLADLIRARAPATQSVLDVACGTGEHARHLRELGFTVDGVDVEPAFVELARRKNPAGRFVRQDMVLLNLEEKYDAVVCLFSSIGYVKTEARLREAIGRFADHAVDGGIVIVEPWFEPAELEDGYVAMHAAQDEHTKICRMSLTRLKDGVSQLDFEYLIGRRGSLERRSEVHELGLFTKTQMLRAFADTGLAVEHDAEGLCGRGLYIGRKRNVVFEPAWSGSSVTPGK